MSKILILISLLLLSSCGDRISRKRDPKLKSNIDPLTNSPVKVLETELQTMGTETRSLVMPKVGETLTYETSYVGTKKILLKKRIGSTTVNCLFSFKKAEITEKVVKVEGSSYYIEKTIIPENAKYEGNPVQTWEEKCFEAVAAGEHTSKLPALLIYAQLKRFKSFVRSNLIDKYNKCAQRVGPTYFTCKDDGIEIDKKSSEVFDTPFNYYDMNFVGQLNGNMLKIDISVNFDRIYFTNFGIQRMNLEGTNSIQFSGISRISTINWTELNL